MPADLFKKRHLLGRNPTVKNAANVDQRIHPLSLAVKADLEVLINKLGITMPDRRF